MKNYFRITTYSPEENVSAIVDCYGKFDQVWQFSAYLVSKGVKVLEVSTDEKFIDGNIPRARANGEHIFIMAARKGKPNDTTITVNGNTYRAVEVAGRMYVPDRSEVV